MLGWRKPSLSSVFADKGGPLKNHASVFENVVSRNKDIAELAPPLATRASLPTKALGMFVYFGRVLRRTRLLASPTTAIRLYHVYLNNKRQDQQTCPPSLDVQEAEPAV